MIEIIPGVGPQPSIDQIAHRVALVAEHSEWIQLDFSDSTMVPQATFMDIGKIAQILAVHPKNSFEAHLMVSNPEKHISALTDAGFKRLIAHVEATEPRNFLRQVEFESVEVGLAIDGTTEVDQIEPYLEELDTVLVMTVEAGASGQPFLPETIEKIRQIHESVPDLPIEVDGGMNEQTAKIVKEAGATRIVTTSYVFKDPTRIAAAIAALKNA